TPDEKVQAGCGEHKEQRRLKLIRDLGFEAAVYELVYYVGLVLHAVHQRGAVDGRGNVVGETRGIGAYEHDGVLEELGGEFARQQVGDGNAVVIAAWQGGE